MFIVVVITCQLYWNNRRYINTCFIQHLCI